MDRAGHPNVVHGDDVSTLDLAVGVLAGLRRRLGAAAGAREIGLSRYVLSAGQRPMPAHSHADEEEIFFVLGGEGISWQDGRAYAIGAGDCLVHRSSEEAHTFLAGDAGLDILGFGEGSATSLTHLPGAGAWWIGGGWLPEGSPHPRELEPELDVGTVHGERPPTIRNLAEVEAEADEEPGYEGVERHLTRGQARRSGLRHVELRPGSLSCPPHWHMIEEELFYVLAGDGEVLLGDDTFALRAGSVVCRPPGSRVAHALRGGPGGMTYLAYGPDRPGEVVYYPRSRKLLVGGVRFRVEPLEYFDGEP